MNIRKVFQLGGCPVVTIPKEYTPATRLRIGEYCCCRLHENGWITYAPATEWDRLKEVRLHAPSEGRAENSPAGRNRRAQPRNT